MIHGYIKCNIFIRYRNVTIINSIDVIRIIVDFCINSYYTKGARIAYGYTGTMEFNTTATIPLDFTPDFVYIASDLYSAEYNSRFVTGVRNDLYVSNSGQSNVYKYQHSANTGVVDTPPTATQYIIINEKEIQIKSPTGPVDIFWIAVKCTN